jgi:hypothetical protein
MTRQDANPARKKEQVYVKLLKSSDDKLSQSLVNLNKTVKLKFEFKLF